MWFDKLLAALPFLAPLVQAISAAVRRAPVPEPGDPDPVTVDAGDPAARAEAARLAATVGGQTK